MITLTETQRAEVELLEGRIKECADTMQALAKLLWKYRDVSPDAGEWLKDAAQNIENARGDLRITLYCARCNRLAVWLHPDTLERYCEGCAQYQRPVTDLRSETDA